MDEDTRAALERIEGLCEANARALGTLLANVPILRQAVGDVEARLQAARIAARGKQLEKHMHEPMRRRTVRAG